MKKIYIILHNIRSVHNAGSIFRTAECAGVSKIFLTGYTPTPLDRFGRERKDFAKVALGAEKIIPWEYKRNIEMVLKILRREGVKIIAVEQAKNSIDYKKVKIKGPTAFIFGNEVSGLSASILKKADIFAEIPLRGKKESLNVSVSTGIILFRILNI
jgi:tRNA G18 (ribose-2'-O)-methylase SpoU